MRQDDGGGSYYSDGSDEYDAADDGLIDDTELVVSIAPHHTALLAAQVSI